MKNVLVIYDKEGDICESRVMATDGQIIQLCKHPCVYTVILLPFGHILYVKGKSEHEDELAEYVPKDELVDNLLALEWIKVEDL